MPSLASSWEITSINANCERRLSRRWNTVRGTVHTLYPPCKSRRDLPYRVISRTRKLWRRVSDPTTRIFVYPFRVSICCEFGGWIFIPLGSRRAAKDVQPQRIPGASFDQLQRNGNRTSRPVMQFPAAWRLSSPVSRRVIIAVETC